MKPHDFDKLVKNISIAFKTIYKDKSDQINNIIFEIEKDIIAEMDKLKLNYDKSVVKKAIYHSFLGKLNADS